MILQELVENLIEVRLKIPEDFLKIRETLTRIGISPKNEKRIYQSCHILHKQKRYFIVHFKELLALDGKSTDFSEDDKLRRNTIASLLRDWGLVEIVDESKIRDKISLSFIKIISHKEKSEWSLYAKYNIGGTKKKLIQPKYVD